MLWKHTPGTPNLVWRGGRERLPGRSHTSAELYGMTSRDCSGKQVESVVLESKQRKSSCKRYGRSLAQTFLEENLYKPLNYMAWLSWLINSQCQIGHRGNTANWKLNLGHILYLKCVLSHIGVFLSIIHHHHSETFTTSCQRVPTAPLTCFPLLTPYIRTTQRSQEVKC